MKITFRGVELCAGGIAGPVSIEHNHSREVQTDRFVRSGWARPVERGNALNEFTFEVEREHADYAAAMDFYLTHASTLPSPETAGNAVFENEDGRTYTLADACLRSARTPRPEGVTTSTTYSLVGGAFTVWTPPSGLLGELTNGGNWSLVTELWEIADSTNTLSTLSTIKGLKAEHDFAGTTADIVWTTDTIGTITGVGVAAMSANYDAISQEQWISGPHGFISVVYLDAGNYAGSPFMFPSTDGDHCPYNGDGKIYCCFGDALKRTRTSTKFGLSSVTGTWRIFGAFPDESGNLNFYLSKTAGEGGGWGTVQMTGYTENWGTTNTLLANQYGYTGKLAAALIHSATNQTDFETLANQVRNYYGL